MIIGRRVIDRTDPEATCFIGDSQGRIRKRTAGRWVTCPFNRKRFCWPHVYEREQAAKQRRWQRMTSYCQRLGISLEEYRRRCESVGLTTEQAMED